MRAQRLFCKWRRGALAGCWKQKKIAALAECHHAQIAPHLYCGPIEGAANIQLSACCPNFLIQESIQDWGGFSAKILKKPVHFEEGWIIPSCEPGLGVELDEECAEQNPWTGTELHLDMQQKPHPRIPAWRALKAVITEFSLSDSASDSALDFALGTRCKTESKNRLQPQIGKEKTPCVMALLD